MPVIILLKLQLCVRPSICFCLFVCNGSSPETLASWTDCTNTRQQWILTYSGLQLAKQLDMCLSDRCRLRQQILYLDFCLHNAREGDSDQANNFHGQLINQAMCTNRIWYLHAPQFPCTNNIMQRAAYIIYALYNVLSALLYCSSAISVCLMCDGSLCGQIITIITQ